VKLPFLDRDDERSRLRAVLRRKEGSLAVLYGRRRCGKSRLLQQVLPKGRTVYYVGDDRGGTIQRDGFAAEIGRRLPGFDRVRYPDWDALFERFWHEARPGTVLALDEFPALVAAAREIPSLLQKRLDRHASRGVHVVLCGSSQRMMQGLILDRTAPLFGRAHEILRISPLPAGWIGKALRLRDPVRAVEAYAAWGGVPRYWELAAEFSDAGEAIRTLVLDPRGVLHEEPPRLLLDDLRDAAQAASILGLVAQGCHRLAEISGRIGKPATSLARPIQRLLELELVRRDIPFGATPRDSKRSLYRIADPFLRFWFRYVEPGRSRLEAGQIGEVASEIDKSFPHHVGGVWEDLARASVARLRIHGRSWKPASCWWGTGIDRKPMEIDLVAESDDGEALLLGEARWSVESDPRRLHEELLGKAERFPLARGRKIVVALWLRASRRRTDGATVLTPEEVLASLR